MDSFRAFRARIGLYFEDNNITDDAKQSIKLKRACGDEGMRRLLASGLSDNELKDPKVIFDFLETQLDGTLKFFLEYIDYNIHMLCRISMNISLHLCRDYVKRPLNVNLRFLN